MQTYLQLITDFTNKQGLPTFGGIVANTDATAKQLLALTHDATEYLMQFEWEEQFILHSFTQVADEDQGALTDLFGEGYRSLVPDTLWNMTQRRAILGPRSQSYYQGIRGLQVGGPLYQYVIYGGHLRIIPAPANATDTLSVITRSQNIIRGAGSVTPNKSRISADDDKFIFPDNVFKLQLEWRWLKQKGQPWQAGRAEALDAVAKNLNKDNFMPTLDLTQGSYELKPGIWVPAGSWNL